MDIIVFRRRLVLCRRRLVLLSSQLRVFTTSLLLLPTTRVHFITAMQLCHHGNAMLFYYNKWLSNIQDFYLDIFNTYLQSALLYVQIISYDGCTIKRIPQALVDPISKPKLLTSWPAIWLACLDSQWANQSNFYFNHILSNPLPNILLYIVIVLSTQHWIYHVAWLSKLRIQICSSNLGQW